METKENTRVKKNINVKINSTLVICLVIVSVLVSVFKLNTQSGTKLRKLQDELNQAKASAEAAVSSDREKYEHYLRVNSKIAETEQHMDVVDNYYVMNELREEKQNLLNSMSDSLKQAIDWAENEANRVDKDTVVEPVAEPVQPEEAVAEEEPAEAPEVVEEPKQATPFDKPGFMDSYNTAVKTAEEKLQKEQEKVNQMPTEIAKINLAITLYMAELIILLSMQMGNKKESLLILNFACFAIATILLVFSI